MSAGLLVAAAVGISRGMLTFASLSRGFLRFPKAGAGNSATGPKAAT
jgi:hypothetical protein